MPCLFIATKNVPDELSGNTFPLQVLTPRGKLLRPLITLEEGHVSTFPVEEAGYYGVRLEVPSGDNFSVSAEALDDQPQEVPEIDFGEDEAHSGIPVCFTKSIPYPLRFGDGTQAAPRTLAFESVRADGEAWEHLSLGLAPPDEEPLQLALDSFVFDEWSDERTLRVSMTSWVHERTVLPQKVEERFAFAQTEGYRPLYIWSRWDDVGCIVLWPPFKGTSTLSFLPTGKAGFIVCSTGADANTESLYNYMLAGSFDSAQTALTPVLNKLNSERPQDPIQAILAAYVQTRVDPRRSLPWLRTLGEEYPHLSDARILAGWELLRQGREEEAKPFFIKADRAGLPMFTEGIRLQLRGVRTLYELFPDDPEIAVASTRAALIAASAVMDSEVTCVRLGQLKIQDGYSPQ